MIRTKVIYEGVHVLLDTDDLSIGQRFERDAKWDHPLLKLEKEKKPDDLTRRPDKG